MSDFINRRRKGNDSEWDKSFYASAEGGRLDLPTSERNNKMLGKTSDTLLKPGKQEPANPEVASALAKEIFTPGFHSLSADEQKAALRSYLTTKKGKAYLISVDSPTGQAAIDMAITMAADQKKSAPRSTQSAAKPNNINQSPKTDSWLD